MSVAHELLVREAIWSVPSGAASPDVMCPEGSAVLKARWRVFAEEPAID
jgi:hypothetical protein